MCCTRESGNLSPWLHMKEREREKCFYCEHRGLAAVLLLLVLVVVAQRIVLVVQSALPLLFFGGGNFFSAFPYQHAMNCTCCVLVGL